MDKRQLLQILKEKGRYISPDGVIDITWLVDENRGFIDVINPNNKYNFKALKTKANSIISNLPDGIWELNPDTPQKGNIYKRLFPNARLNPKMPNNALILDIKPNITQTLINSKTARAIGAAGLFPGMLAGTSKAADIYVAQDSARKFKDNPNIDTGIQATLDAAAVPDPTPIANILGLGWANKGWVNRAIGNAKHPLKGFYE